MKDATTKTQNVRQHLCYM